MREIKALECDLCQRVPIQHEQRLYRRSREIRSGLVLVKKTWAPKNDQLGSAGQQVP